ncbi:hypothetical protein HY642_02920 [Candidatus Woesearchaeota archaeon]|nr:hypothetical protein [Candidatus Woesearchaeota archaeon]
MDVGWLFLPGVLAVGMHASWTDARQHRIRNKAVLCGIAYGFAVWLLLGWLVGFAAMGGWLFVLNLLSSALVGYALWLFGGWSPGDGKLFTAMTVMIPAIDPWVPFSLLVNSLVPALIGIAAIAIARERRLGAVWRAVRPWALAQSAKGNLPLAPFLSAGALLTLALKTDVVTWLVGGYL